MHLIKRYYIISCCNSWINHTLVFIMFSWFMLSIYNIIKPSNSIIVTRKSVCPFKIYWFLHLLQELFVWYYLVHLIFWIIIPRTTINNILSNKWMFCLLRSDTLKELFVVCTFDFRASLLLMFSSIFSIIIMLYIMDIVFLSEEY